MFFNYLLNIKSYGHVCKVVTLLRLKNKFDFTTKKNFWFSIYICLL